MTVAKVLISPSPGTGDDWRSWLADSSSMVQSIHEEAFHPALEMNVRRLGQPGSIGDNPPLDEIDALLQQVQQEGLCLGALCIPFQLGISPEQSGFEVSALNGWADLMSYADIGMARLKVTHPCSFLDEQASHVLSTIMTYMNDMDIDISLSLSDEDRPAWLSFLRSLPEEQKPRTGFDIQTNLQPLSSLNVSDLPVKTLSIPTPKEDFKQTVHRVMQTLSEISSETIGAIVMEIE